ncbi:MAG: hypothetical protein ACP5PT_01440 [Brevinematia bacterium]
MGYKIYQLLKYFLISVIVFLGVLYMAKTDRLPKFIPDDIRNSLVDFSDSVLSYDMFKVVYKPFSDVVDFLADDGYTYKYEELPKVLVDRINSELNVVDNNINLLLNNPLFETWIVTSLVSGSQILKEVFTNYFNENFYVGFGVYNSKLYKIFSYSTPELKNPGVLLNGNISFYDNYLLRIKKLSKEVDFIEGYFVVFIDAKKFFDYVFDSEKDNFEIIFLYSGGKVYYSTRQYDYNYISSIIGIPEVNIGGKSFFQKQLSFSNINIGFVYPKPSAIRWVFIGVKLIILGVILYFLIILNNLIKSKLAYSQERKKMIIKSLRNGVRMLPFKSDEEIHNTLVKATEKNLRYFEEFVKTDISSSKASKKKISFFNRS